MKFLNFGSIQEDIQGKVKQDLKFKTGKFVWRVRFSAPLDPATVNNKNLYVYLYYSHCNSCLNRVHTC